MRNKQRGFLNPPPFFNRFSLDSVDFDGSTYLSRTSNLSGVTSTKLGTLSLWFRLDADHVDSQYLLQAYQHTSGSIQIELAINSSDEIELVLGSVSFGIIADVVSNSTFSAGSAWHHLYAYWDTGTSTAGMIIDGSANSTTNVMNNQAVDFNNSTRWAVGYELASGGLPWNGCLADVWFAPGVNLGASGVTKFRDGEPIRLGSSGQNPTGNPPAIYLHIDDGEAASHFATNRSGNGDFTVTGTLATGSTSPMD